MDRLNHLIVVLSLFLLLFASSGYAAEDPIYADTTPGLYKVPSKFITAFDRYDPYTGMTQSIETDLFLPDSSGLDIRIVRTPLKLDLDNRYENNHTVGPFWGFTLSRTIQPGNGGPYVHLPDGTVQSVSKDLWRMKTLTEVVPCEEDNCSPFPPKRRYYQFEVRSPDGTTYVYKNLKRSQSCRAAVSARAIMRCSPLIRVSHANGAYYNIRYTSKSYEIDEVDYYFDAIRQIIHSNGTIVTFNYSAPLDIGPLTRAIKLISIEVNNKVVVNYTYPSKSKTSLNMPSVYYADGSGWNRSDGITPYGKGAKFTSHLDSNRRLVKRELKIPGYGTIRSEYDYKVRLGETESITKVFGDNYCETYTYKAFHKENRNYIGTLQKKVVYDNRDCASNKLKEVSYKYKNLKLSDVKERFELSSRFLNASIVADATYKHLVSEIKTTYYAQELEKDQFITTYSDFDAYGNPKTITETNLSYQNIGTDGSETPMQWVENSTRTAHRTYKNLTSDSIWRLGLIATESIDGIEGQVSYEYDSKGRLLSKNSYGEITKYTYNDIGHVTSITDANGQTYNYSDFKRGIAQTVSGPESYSVNRAVDNYGNVTSQTHWGRTSGYSFDNANRLTKIATPSASDFDTAISYAYNNDGFRQTVSQGDRLSETQYSGFGQPLWQKETFSGQSEGTPASSTVYFKYDDQGRPIFSSYANNQEQGTTTTYDALGRITKITANDGAETTYQYLAGNRVKITDASGNSVINTYLSWGDPSEKYLIKTEQLATTENSDAIVSDAITTTIARNNLGLIESVTQGNFTQTYTYNSAWRLASITTPEVGKTTFVYDANGNVTQKTVGSNGTIVYSYDHLNRITDVNFPGAAADLSYQYNSHGQLASVSKGNYQWRYSYNDNGTLLTETLANSSAGKSWGFEYGLNQYDNVDSLTYPGGFKIAYKPDSAGRATQASTYASNIQYHANGSLSSLTYGNGHTLTIGKDNRERPNQLSVNNSVLDLTYAYYQDSDVKSITDNLNSANTIAMQYDQHHRLRKVSGALWGSGEVTYDVNGNITSKNINDIDLNYSYSNTNNRLTSVSGDKAYSFGYDGYGNVTSNGHFTFSYDHDGTMLDAQNNDTFDLFEYEYDAYNRRVKQSKAGELEKYSVYNQAGQLLMDEDSDGYRTYYVHAGGQRIAAVAQCADTDTDGDKLADCEENHIGFDPDDATDGNADTDNDGLTNAYEYNAGLDMNEADTDGDGMNDGWEVANGLDPLTNDASADADNDGLTNSEEYAAGTKANNADTDGDGIADASDDKPNFNLAAFIPVMQLILN